MSRAKRLRDLAVMAYWAARTPIEAKIAGVLLDLFAPDVVRLDGRGDDAFMDHTP